MAAGNTYTSAGNFTISTSGSPTFTGGTFNNSGVLTKISADTDNMSTSFDNTGLLDLKAGTLAMEGTFHQTAGETLLEGGTLTASSAISFSAGILGGSGNLTDTSGVSLTSNATLA